MWPLLLNAASAADAPVLGVIWALSVDGQPVGTREATVRWEGESGDRVRILESWTELAWTPRKKRDAWGFRQRLTANAMEGAPASFHCAVDADGAPLEIQGRYGEGVWRVSVTAGAHTETSTLNAGRIDLSSVDLFDPEGDRKLAAYDHVRILSAESGAVLEGPVIGLGPAELAVGDETLWVDGWEWRTAEGPWRFWYASNGFLVRYEVPLLGHRVEAKVLGAVPLGVDEFPLPAPPRIEVLDLP